LAITEAQAGTAAAPQRLVLTGVTIVDTHDGRKTRDMTIAIQGGKIARISGGDQIETSDTQTTIDATGKFVVPGYLDMHAHPLQSRDAEGGLNMMLVHGITGVRQMSGSAELLAAHRAGTLVPWAGCPELLALPGTILTPFNAGSPEAALAEVQKQKAAGADFIKVVEVSRAAFFAALGEADRLGLPFTGHIPATVSVRQAAIAGMRAVEHLFGSLEACSTAEAALLEPAQPVSARSAAVVEAPDPAAMERALANPILVRPPGYAREARIVETYSEDKSHSLAREFASAGTWQVPTLIRLRTMEFGDDPQYRNDPNLQYVPFATRQVWHALAEQFATRLAPAEKHVMSHLFSLQSGLVRVFKEAGVKMLAGSDSGGGWCIPGAALHQEFELLHDAGVSPLEILQMTTLNGAKFLGREDSMGSVAEGKNADLVLLDADPLASVKNLKEIYGVVRGGSYYSSDMLEALKERTQERYLAPTQLPLEL
jgi:cytosine/adenosine deaminase-related metal-dependent hydrolase